MQLFSACTDISLGNGQRARFWMDRWLQGMAPSSIAPELFVLARQKNLSVVEALTANRWMKGLQRMDNEQAIDQFIKLWEMIQSVTLSDGPDTITWKLNKDGIYSSESAYSAQFIGRIITPSLNAAWKVKAEPKVRFYTWLLLQNRN